MGASALYWIISGASEISISPTSSVGSIGVVSTYHKDGDKDDTIEFVSSVSPRKRLDPETDEGRAEVMEAIDKIAEVFVADVAAGRNTSPEDVVQNFGQGGMLVGQQALDAGMVDKVCTFEELMARLSEQDTTSYGDNPMNVAELKADYPEVYEALLKEGVATADKENGDNVSSLTSANEALVVENTQLKADVEKAGEENKENSVRIQVLEKTEAIRQTKDMEASADVIANALISGSDIPTSLHTKVRACINHEDFITEGALDEKGFTAAMKTEVADWTASLEETNTTLAGFGDGGDEAHDDQGDDKVDQAVDRLMAHIN